MSTSLVEPPTAPKAIEYTFDKRDVSTQGLRRRNVRFAAGLPQIWKRCLFRKDGFG